MYFTRLISFVLTGLFVVSLISCEDELPFQRKAYVFKTPWETYLEALDSNGLKGTQMVASWRLAGMRALNDSLTMTGPFRETTYFRAASPEAISYRIALKKGELLKINLQVYPDSTLLFADLFFLEKEDSTTHLRHRFNAEPYELDSLVYEAEAAGIYLLRLQPELLSSCRVSLDLLVQPVYGWFPVSGKGNSAVWSFFGDPRDGGRRSHKGVDIFARRGTPVVAATDGVVRSVRDRGLGGKQVWLSDRKRSQSLYYAHLDSQLVKEGAVVKAGDTLGLVGNTGNARSTKPHLHFSIYRRGSGAIDPYPFIARQSDRPARITADTSRIGAIARIRTNAPPLRVETNRKSHVIATLSRHLPLWVIAASKNYYRVRTPDGLEGYLHASVLEPLDQTLDQLKPDQPMELLESPHSKASPVALVEAEDVLSVLGRNGEYQLVETEQGNRGWIKWTL